MKALIRYTTKPEHTAENVRLIEATFAELAIKEPGGLHYVSMTYGEGNFAHFVTMGGDDNPLRKLESFQAFQRGQDERFAGEAIFEDVTILGSYRMLD
jgi:hypothetical protein